MYLVWNMALNSSFQFSSTNSDVPVMNHCHKKVKGNQKANDKKAKEKMKYINKILTKTERNR